MFRPVVMVLGVALGLTGFTAQAGDPFPWGQRAAPNSFLYVRFTGVVTMDGFPVATHVDCSTVPDCTVGWKLDGKPLKATFLHHPMHDHPVFEVARSDIPQPGSYSHFHWLGQAMPQPNIPVDGYLLQLTAMNRFCFIHHDAGIASSAASCRDNVGLKVDRGIDMASHLNIATVPHRM